MLINFKKRFSIKNHLISQNPEYNWVPTSHVPIMALSLLSNTVTFNTTIDYYLRKKAFAFIIAIDCFTRPKMEKKKKQAEEQLRKTSLLKLAKEARIELKRREKITILRIREEAKQIKAEAKRTREEAKRHKKEAKRNNEEAKRTKAAAQRIKILNRMLLKRARTDTLR